MKIYHVFPGLAAAASAYTNYQHDPNKSLSENVYAREALLPGYQPPDHGQIAHLAYILGECYSKDADSNWFAAERILETGWSYELRIIREVALYRGLSRDAVDKLRTERYSVSETIASALKDALVKAVAHSSSEEQA